MTNPLFKLCDGYFGSFNYSSYCNYEILFKCFHLFDTCNEIYPCELYAYENFSSEISLIFFENNADGPAMDVQS